MSLKAKLEAVIYAAEEPVTLNQLAALFAADALEWKAAQEAAAAEQTAEVAGSCSRALSRCRFWPKASNTWDWLTRPTCMPSIGPKLAMTPMALPDRRSRLAP